MYAIARPGLPMHINISWGQNTACILSSWQHEHAAAVHDDDTVCHLYRLQNAVGH